jgi:hypothetical protein
MVVVVVAGGLEYIHVLRDLNLDRPYDASVW